MAFPIAVDRGCGRRVSNGVYWETGLSPYGRPLEDFLLDPPIRVPPDVLASTSAVGVHLHQSASGTWHVFDRIGREFYPHVTDFIEEVRRFGLSRRLPANLEFHRLTPDSRLVLIHDRAYIENFDAYGVGWTCPKQKESHADLGPDFCFGGCWEDLEQGTPVVPGLLEVRREMPSFEYFARLRPEGVVPEYSPAFFASFPCSRIAVVAGDQSTERLARARKAQLPVSEVPR